MKLRWQVWLLALLLPCGGLRSEVSTVLDAGALNPSERCATCHRAIYDKWKGSMHSMSYTDPVFLSSYMRAYLESGGKARELCLRCHAPVAVFTGDLGLAHEVSREGVTCDFCHSVHSVRLERAEQPYEVRLDGVKRGPFADADSPAHPVGKSSLHTSAEFCAGCHEYTNPVGVSILGTYSEWKASPQAAQGKTCQVCHMPETAGTTVREEFGIRRNFVNLHDISGMHSSEQVRRAATARILTLERRQPSVAVVEVEVANVGSGHGIPTGLPTRKLVLTVELFANGKLARSFERSYQKELLDAAGQVIVEDHRVMLAAAKIRDDTRLMPGERRVERFVATVPEKAALSAKMQLHYTYEPMVLSRERMVIEIATGSYP